MASIGGKPHPGRCESIGGGTALAKTGIHTFDALHVASSIAGNAALFIATDDRLLKRVRHLKEIKALFPADALAFLQDWYEH